MAYQHVAIEKKWQEKWKNSAVFKTGTDHSKQKYYVLDMFPYPSAAGLHIGHPLGYVATDIIARYQRMLGKNVLHPMGWDAFGLPAEQHAIDTGEHPAKVTENNILNFKRQLSALGLSFDWDREVSTADPHFYKWTQWIFKKLYEKGLAYQSEVLVNWCPYLKTVLANEEVVDGKSERGGHDVLRVPMKQWMLKITDYAERLLKDLDDLDWPESTKEIQRHWIGKSVGATAQFSIHNHNNVHINIFTTRIDTLFGVSFLVVSPEHPLLQTIVSEECKADVQRYQSKVATKSDLERTQLSKEKTGVFSGAYAIHPATQEKIPIWIADYVLMNYGTGAIMAVPAHDERDHEFAKQFGLKIPPVIDFIEISEEEPHDYEKAARNGTGVCVNSSFLDGLSTQDAKVAAIEFLEEKGCGKATITYRLRDWIFSRQRYWGEPFPILKNSEGDVIGCLEESDLPLTLPIVTSYEPTGNGKSPLSTATSWVQRKNQKGELEYLETDTMPGSAGSSWYFIRYTDPCNALFLASLEEQKYWLPVDLYVGGQEHAVGHLLYSRFWTKVLYDIGACPVSEPFQKLVHQGLLCRHGAKMSKSKGNGVSPDDVIRDFGSDALRVYLMFMGPLTQTKEWEDNNLAGVYRFLSRIHRFFLNENGDSLVSNQEADLVDLKILHKTVKKVTQDIDALSFNTAIAQMMILLNHMAEKKSYSYVMCAGLLKCLAPFAPHLAEELWEKSGFAKEEKFVSLASWPTFDEKYTIDNEVHMGVQVNGKFRGEILIPRDATQEEAVAEADKVPAICAAKDGKTLVKTIYVKGKILNFVVRD